MGEEDVARYPTSELDLSLMMTDSVWGRNDVLADLRDKLGVYYKEYDKEGKEFLSKKSLWGLLGFFTRDMRLGNLSSWNGELESCRFHINLANDLLNVGMNEPFLISLSRTASILETSQSKGGFLRKMMNTLIHNNINRNDEPPKKGFFGGKNNNNGGGY